MTSGNYLSLIVSIIRLPATPKVTCDCCILVRCHKLFYFLSLTYIPYNSIFGTTQALYTYIHLEIIQVATIHLYFVSTHNEKSNTGLVSLNLNLNSLELNLFSLKLWNIDSTGFVWLIVDLLNVALHIWWLELKISCVSSLLIIKWSLGTDISN